MSTRTTVFIAVIALLLVVGGVASRRANSKEALLVGGGVSTTANGLAITGEFASVATFLGLVGGVSLTGFSGLVGVLGVPLGFLVLLVVVAGPLRRTGRFTIGDMVARGMPSPTLRVVLGVIGLVISAVYMIGQFVGGASLIGALFGFGYPVAILVIGGLTLVLVLMGGMTSATAVQVMKTVLLMAASVTILLLALESTGWNPLEGIATARDQYGPTATTPQHTDHRAALNGFSATVATVFGIAGMPHLMVRLLTVRTAAAARRSSLLAIWIMSCYLVIMTLVGYAASVLVGRDTIAGSNAGGTTATILVAESLAGPVFEAVVAGLVFAIIAAVLAGLLVSMMGTISHDLYPSVVRTPSTDPRRQVNVARGGAVAVTVIASALALGAEHVNLIFVGTFAFGVAASTIFPVIVLSLYWRRFTLRGALAGLVMGLASSILLLVLSPIVMGGGAVFPYSQPAVFTIPAAFLAACVGSLLGNRRTAVTTPAPDRETAVSS